MNELIGQRLRATPNWITEPEPKPVVTGKIVAVGLAPKSGWVFLIRNGRKLSMVSMACYDVEVDVP